MKIVTPVRVVAQLAAGAFAGTCTYILVVQQPVRMTAEIRTALEDFRRGILLQERIQLPLHGTALAGTALLAALNRRWTAVAAAASLGLVLAQTLTLVVPVNNRLLAGTVEDHVEDGRAEMRHWGIRHRVRTALAAGAAVLVLL